MLITLLMFPLLLWVYVRLALTEKRDAEARFGDQWQEYASRTPRFFLLTLRRAQ
jgi:protein-S-isoprenylcysteine O-methyltransferase Ste14